MSTTETPKSKPYNVRRSLAAAKTKEALLNSIHQVDPNYSLPGVYLNPSPLHPERNVNALYRWQFSKDYQLPKRADGGWKSMFEFGIEDYENMVIALKDGSMRAVKWVRTPVGRGTNLESDAPGNDGNNAEKGVFNGNQSTSNNNDGEADRATRSGTEEFSDLTDLDELSDCELGSSDESNDEEGLDGIEDENEDDDAEDDEDAEDGNEEEYMCSASWAGGVQLGGRDRTKSRCFRRARFNETRQILYDHLCKTLPSLASSITIDDALIRFHPSTKPKYKWELVAERYQLPTYPKAGYTDTALRKKTLLGFSSKDHLEIREAIKQGWMKAVALSDGENDVVTTSNRNLHRTGASFKHDDDDDDSGSLEEKREAGRSNSDGKSTMKEHNSSASHRSSAICSKDARLAEQRERTRKSKEALLKHIRMTLPEIASAFKSINSVYIKDHHRAGHKVRPYDWELSEEYSFPVRLRGGQKNCIQLKSLLEWKPEDHDRMKRALDKGWLKAVLSNSAIESGSRTLEMLGVTEAHEGEIMDTIEVEEARDFGTAAGAHRHDMPSPRAVTVTGQIPYRNHRSLSKPATVVSSITPVSGGKGGATGRELQISDGNQDNASANATPYQNSSRDLENGLNLERDRNCTEQDEDISGSAAPAMTVEGQKTGPYGLIGNFQSALPQYQMPIQFSPSHSPFLAFTETNEAISQGHRADIRAVAGSDVQPGAGSVTQTLSPNPPTTHSTSSVQTEEPECPSVANTTTQIPTPSQREFVNISTQTSKPATSPIIDTSTQTHISPDTTTTATQTPAPVERIFQHIFTQTPTPILPTTTETSTQTAKPISPQLFDISTQTPTPVLKDFSHISTQTTPTPRPVCNEAATQTLLIPDLSKDIISKLEKKLYKAQRRIKKRESKVSELEKKVKKEGSTVKREGKERKKLVDLWAQERQYLMSMLEAKEEERKRLSEEKQVLIEERRQGVKRERELKDERDGWKKRAKKAEGKKGGSTTGRA
ncbi:hypothetical protein BJ508DRAFT_330019 [Ascobolus immersus RN42]|uniref:Uncharacterized protein n=1 Tax=Ascobolus immersus RN42 TaxID=1160509 RepID=A0A3N4HV19_ASCIM|nr:hypothetical protein BJ508DRAFT_330019 [Ascobolus immersus RN42]